MRVRHNGVISNLPDVGSCSDTWLLLQNLLMMELWLPVVPLNSCTTCIYFGAANFDNDSKVLIEHTKLFWIRIRTRFFRSSAGMESRTMRASGCVQREQRLSPHLSRIRYDGPEQRQLPRREGHGHSLCHDRSRRQYESDRSPVSFSAEVGEVSFSTFTKSNLKKGYCISCDVPAWRD